MDILSQDIKYLPGVGPNRKKMLSNELGIETYGDLLENIGKIRSYIRANVADEQKNVGIIAGTDIVSSKKIIFCGWLIEHPCVFIRSCDIASGIHNTRFRKLHILLGI